MSLREAQTDNGKTYGAYTEQGSSLSWWLDLLVQLHNAKDRRTTLRRKLSVKVTKMTARAQQAILEINWMGVITRAFANVLNFANVAFDCISDAWLMRKRPRRNFSISHMILNANLFIKRLVHKNVKWVIFPTMALRRWKAGWILRIRVEIESDGVDYALAGVGNPLYVCGVRLSEECKQRREVNLVALWRRGRLSWCRWTVPTQYGTMRGNILIYTGKWL